MAKFSDLNPERQRQLIATMRCLELAVESLARMHGVKGSRAVRMQLIARADSDTEQLSDHQIANLVKKLDEINDAKFN